MTERTTLVDFIARGDSPDEWQMVLVEEGPWAEPTDSELGRIQDRLYGAIDAALDGKVAEQFPESLGKTIVIQLDCYNGPANEIAEFFKSFASGVLETEDYKKALTDNRFVRSIRFRSSFQTLE